MELVFSAYSLKRVRYESYPDEFIPSTEVAAFGDCVMIPAFKRRSKVSICGGRVSLRPPWCSSIDFFCGLLWVFLRGENIEVPDFLAVVIGFRSGTARDSNEGPAEYGFLAASDRFRFKRGRSSGRTVYSFSFWNGLGAGVGFDVGFRAFAAKFCDAIRCGKHRFLESSVFDTSVIHGLSQPS